MLGFRDRISIVAWVAGLVLVVQPILLAPSWQITWFPFGTPLTVTVDRDFLLALLLFPALIGGTQWILRAWDVPYRGTRLREGAWTLPLAVGWLALRLLPHQPTTRAWVVFLAGALLILALTWHTLSRLLGKVPAEYPVGLVWRVLVFAVAGVLYLWLYGLRVRSLLATTQMLVGTYLLAVSLWLSMSFSPRARWLYGLVVAFIVAQFAWAFRQIALGPLRGGLLLLLLFYMLTALVERGARERLDARVIVEFTATVVLALVLILLI